MAMRRAIDAAPAVAAVAVAWGFRDACPPPSKETSDAVLLVLQEALLDTVGVLGIRLGAINIAWAEAVSGRRKKVWRVLKREPEKDLGGQGRAQGQLWYPHDVTSLPEGAVCVADTFNHRLQIFSKEQGAAPRIIGSFGTQPGQFMWPRGVACDGTSLYVADSANNRVQKLRPLRWPRPALRWSIAMT